MSEPAEQEYRAGDIQRRTLEFGIAIVNFVDSIPPTTAGRAVVSQLVRCGTGIGALMEEADAAESRADFIHKVSIALKEAREARYWLRLILKSNLGASIERSQIVEIGKEADALVRIIYKIRQNSRE